MLQNGPRGNPAPPPRPSGISALSNLVSHAVAPVEHVAQVVQHSAPARAYIAAHSAPAPRPTAPSPRLAAAIASRPASASSSRAASSSGAATRLATRIAAALKMVETAGASLGLLSPNVGSPWGFKAPNEGLDWLPNQGLVYPHTLLPDSLPGRPAEGESGHFTHIEPLQLAPHVPGVSRAEQQFLHGFGVTSHGNFGLARPRSGNFSPLGKRSGRAEFE